MIYMKTINSITFIHLIDKVIKADKIFKQRRHYDCLFSDEMNIIRRNLYYVESKLNDIGLNIEINVVKFNDVEPNIELLKNILRTHCLDNDDLDNIITYLENKN